MTLEWATSDDWDGATSETNVSHPGDTLTLSDGATSGSLTTVAQSPDDVFDVPTLATTVNHDVGTITTATVTESLADGGTTSSSYRYVASPESGLWGDDFETELSNEWTVHASNFGVRTDRVYDGAQSVGIKTDNAQAQLAECQPDALTDGQQITGFRFYWNESSSSHGGGLRFNNSQGDPEISFATDNPQWMVHDGNGITQIKGKDGAYGNWVEVRFVFDWANATVSIRVEDFGTGTVKTHTGPMKQGLDIETISLENYDSGSSPPWASSNCYMWFDGFVIESESPPAVTENTYPPLDGLADSEYEVTLGLEATDARYAPSVGSVSIENDVDLQLLWQDTFDDDSLDDWEIINGNWDGSSNTLYNTSGENNSWITRLAAVDFGHWSFEHYHGPQFYGAKFVLSPDKPSGESSAQPDTCYKIQFANTNNGYDRYLRAYENGTENWNVYLGSGDGSNWHTCTLIRIPTADGGAYWIGSYDDNTFTYEEAPEDVLEGINYLSFQGGDSGHRFDTVSVERTIQQDDTGNGTGGTFVLSSLSSPTTSSETVTTGTQTAGLTTLTSTADIPTTGTHTSGPTITTIRATSTSPSAARSLAILSNGLTALDLLRIMPVATIVPGLRSNAVEQQQTLAGGIEHNDLVRQGALAIERVVFPGYVRRVPSPPHVRLRKFEHVTASTFVEQVLRSSPSVEAGTTDGTHDVDALAALPDEYDTVIAGAHTIGVLSAVLSGSPVTNGFYPIGLANALGESYTSFDGTQTQATLLSTLLASTWPVTNDAYPLQGATSAASGPARLAKPMLQGQVVAVIDGRPAMRQTPRTMASPSVLVWAALLDGATSYDLALTAVRFLAGGAAGGGIRRVGDFGGIDATQDVVFNSMRNGLNAQ